MQSIEEIRRDVEELRQKIRQDRIARGVPEEAPEDFVSEAMTTVLIERCKPLFQYVAKYTQLCSQSNQVLHANVEIFDRYREYLTLIDNAKSDQNTFAIGLSIAKRYMLESDDYTDASGYVRRLGQALNLARLGFEMKLDHAAYRHDVSVELLGGMYKEAKDEYDRLQADEAFLKAEVKRYMEHYESIKHLF
ncbi:hypothetical protein ABER68_04180 [Paenibacillus alvei]